VLDPAGPQSDRVAHLWWLYFWVCVVVFALVIFFTMLAVWRWRREDADDDTPIVNPPASAERSRGIFVGACVVITTIILFVLLIGDFRVGRDFHRFANQSDFVAITVTGHQWWWEFTYEDGTPSNYFTTANEMHIPTGRPVRLRLQAADVIHSFWAPNLAGKKDLIPGHDAELWIQADRDGHYYGQCAEYCGFQHAHMRFVVIAEPLDQFKSWVADQRAPATEPTAQIQYRGRDVFTSQSCALCHTIRGTLAGGRVGPDLTHVASRETIAAGRLPNTMGHLGGWIIDPQRIKPGVRMPQNAVAPDDLQALLEYLESLK
jgi:cytochrome c oxidase subunit 2